MKKNTKTAGEMGVNVIKIHPSVAKRMPVTGQYIHRVVSLNAEDEPEDGGPRIINNSELTTMYTVQSEQVFSTNIMEGQLIINGEVKLPLDKDWELLPVTDKIFVDQEEAFDMETKLNDAQAAKITKVIEDLTAIKVMLAEHRSQDMH